MSAHRNSTNCGCARTQDTGERCAACGAGSRWPPQRSAKCSACTCSLVALRGACACQQRCCMHITRTHMHLASAAAPLLPVCASRRMVHVHWGHVHPRHLSLLRAPRLRSFAQLETDFFVSHTNATHMGAVGRRLCHTHYSRAHHRRA